MGIPIVRKILYLILLVSLLFTGIIGPAIQPSVAQSGPLTTQFTYDPNGNIKMHTDANGAITRYEYDVLNRLTAIRYPEGPPVTFTYDEVGAHSDERSVGHHTLPIRHPRAADECHRPQSPEVGFVRRRTLELLLRQVEAISVDQTILGRFLGFGSVTLTGTGGVREVFHQIARPLEFRRQIQRQVA